MLYCAIMSTNQSAERRTPQDEIATQHALATHLLGSAVSAAAEGDMEAFGYAMDIRRETEARIRAISASELNRQMRERMSELLGRGSLLRGMAFGDPADRHFREPITEALAEALADARPTDPIILLNHHYGARPPAHTSEPEMSVQEIQRRFDDESFKTF